MTCQLYILLLKVKCLLIKHNAVKNYWFFCRFEVCTMLIAYTVVTLDVGVE